MVNHSLEKAIAESPLQAILARLATAAIVVDFDGQFVSSNHGAEILFGESADSAIESFKRQGVEFSWLNPDRRAKFSQRLDRSGVQVEERLCLLADGRQVRIESEAVLIPGENGDDAGLAVLLRDVTGRKSQELEIQRLKELETKLRQREHELAEAQRIAGIGSWHWVIATDTVTWSEEVYRIFELDPANRPPTYEQLEHLHTPESWARLSAAVAKTVSFGEPYELDVEIRLPSGNTRWITARGEAECYADGKVTQLRGTLQEITERKLNEARLQRSESRYRSLIRAGTNIVWTTTPEGKQTHELPEWQAFTGQTAEELRGFGWAEAIHPEDREATLAAWRESMRSGRNFAKEQRLRRRDGVYRSMAVRAVPSRNPAGEIVEWVGMHTDITEQKKSEEALRRSQSTLQKLYNAGFLGICYPDRFGAFKGGNDEFLRVVGFTREDLEAGLVRWDKMTPPEYAQLDAFHIAEAAERGSCTAYEKEYIRKDGSRVPILCGYALLEGSQADYIGFILDLSAQKAAEAALRNSERMYRTVGESIEYGVWTCDAEGRNTYASESFLKLIGLSQQECSDFGWANLLHPDDAERTVALWKDCVRTQGKWDVEHRFQGVDGQWHHVLARGGPIFDDRGRVTGWAGINLNVSQLKQAEEALRRSEKLAATGRLAASIAHEINNPLEAVTNSLYLALQDSGLAPETRQYLTMADQELARVAHVTTQTLRFHRQSIAPAWLDLSVIMESAFSLFEPRFKAAGILVEREYMTDEKTYCCGEEIRQVFTNLIGNSLDAVRHGGQVRIRIRKARSWNHPATEGLCVTVADSGHGVPQDLAKRIFEPFVTTKDATGTGLGLWVADGIVRKHGGQISLRSTTDAERHGTVFRLFLPFGGFAQTERR